MKLSTKTYYGLKSMIRLAKEAKPCTVKEISLLEKIPVKYLEKIFQELRAEGFLFARSGKNGGYTIAKPASSLKAGEVVMALEKEVFLTRCQASCPMAGKCSSQVFWQEMQASFEASFGKKTLADLIK